MNGDNASELTRKAINILFVANPRGTSIGVLLGVVLNGLFGVFSPALKVIQFINITAIKLWHFMAFGVIAMNLPAYLRRKEIDPSIINAISFIENEKKKGHILEWQARQMYMNLYAEVLKSVTLDPSKNESESRVNSLAVNSDFKDEQNN